MNSGVRSLAALTLSAVVVATSTSAPPAQATQQPPGPPPVSFSVDVALIEVDAVVTDGEGRVIRDLRQEEFQLFDDGKLQTIDRLSFVEIPIARGDEPAHRPVRTDVTSNLHPFDGRLYVVLLDDLHTAASRSERVKAAARQFVESALEPGDLAAVVHTSGAGGANQDFTTDRALLLASIDRFGGRQLTSQTANELDDYNRQLLMSGRTPATVRDRDEGVRAGDARAAFDTIAGIARRLAPVRGRRKALLWFGEGPSYDMFDMARTQASLVRESSRAAIAAASAANVAIYAVDPRGLAGMGEEVAQLTNPSADPTKGLDALGLNREMVRSQTNLRRASAETGGFAVTNTDEFARAFDRVVVENSAYYLLAYYPAETPRDPAFHRLEVRVTRAGARVRARSGYVATAPRSEPPAGDRDSRFPAALRDALASLVPQSGLPMAVHVAAFRGASSKASALVTVEYAARSFESGGATGVESERLEVSVIAVDPDGKVAASDHAAIPLDVQPATRRAMQVLGFRTHARLDLPPGRYQVRAAALLRGRSLVGSVYRDVEIPDFTRARLSMSDLVLTSVVAGYTPTARLDERMREVLPAPPAAERHFRNDEAVALFAELYQGADGPSGDLHLWTRVMNAAGGVVFEREDVRTPEELTRVKSGYSTQVSLRGLPPGDYQLQLEAVSAADRSRTARTTAFHVWDVPAGLPFVSVAKGAISGIATSGETVVRTEAAWDALWQSLALRGTRPAVRFADTMVVAVFLGTRPTAGYEAEVVGVRQDGDDLVVQWLEHGPRSPGNPPLPTTPFVLAGVPRHPGVVRFEKVTKE